MYEVIVVGGGHNGLTSAAYLAKAGKRVLVLEAREVVGGLAWTKEMDNAPGYRVNPCSVEFLMTGVEPSVDSELELHKYGLRWVYPDTLLTWVGPEGQAVPIWRDRSKLVDEIKRYSVKDARRYEQLCDEITMTLKALIPYLQGHPWRLRPGTVGEMLKGAVKGRKHLAAGARILSSSIEAVCEEYFERDEIKVPVATYSLASFAPAWEPGTGLHLSLIAGLHEWGVRHPVGGTGAFTQALSNCIRAHGGEVITKAYVQQIDAPSGVVTGVTLTDGRTFPAKQVIGAVDPTTLMTKLLDPSVVPSKALDEIRGVQNLHSNLYTFKIDAALDRRLKFPIHGQGRSAEAMSAITICEDMRYLNDSANLAMAGDFDHRIPIQHITSSVYDRTLVPEGSDGDTLYLYAFNTPVELSGGRSWADEKQRYADLMLDNFAQYAPEVRDAIIDIEITSPPDFASRYHVTRGNYEHVDCTLAQMGPGRPTPSLRGWQTPVEGLWHTGAGAFPMAFLSGWPGRGTAREVLRSDTTAASRLVGRLKAKTAQGVPVDPRYATLDPTGGIGPSAVAASSNGHHANADVAAGLVSRA